MGDDTLNLGDVATIEAHLGSTYCGILRIDDDQLSVCRTLCSAAIMRNDECLRKNTFRYVGCFVVLVIYDIAG